MRTGPRVSWSKESDAGTGSAERCVSGGSTVLSVCSFW